MSNAHSDQEMLKAYFVSDLLLGYTFRHIPFIEELRLGLNINNLFNAKYESNGYSGAGYYVDADGSKVIYRYAGYAAQAPTNAMGTITIRF